MELGAALLSSQSSLIRVLSIYCEIPDARDCVFSLSVALHSPWMLNRSRWLIPNPPNKMAGELRELEVSRQNQVSDEHCIIFKYVYVP